MTREANSPEAIRNLNRKAISDGIESICEEMEQFKGEFKISEQIELTNESGQNIKLHLLVEMSLEYKEPFVTISIFDSDGSSVASRILAISLDKNSENPRVVVTDRVDTFEYEGIGIGSGLLQASELVVKKVVALSAFPKDVTVVLRLHDATNNGLHPKQGWSGSWATKLGYTPVTGQKDYFKKVLVGK